MRILGIDPGVASTGWGIVEEDRTSDNGLRAVDYGVVKTLKTEDLAARLSQIFKEITKLIKKYKPDYAAVEQLFFCNNAKTAITVGEARGVILMALNDSAVPFKEFTPLQVKDAVCGYGRADKKQVQAMVRALLAMDKDPKPDDAADGLALAICCASVGSLEKKLNQM